MATRGLTERLTEETSAVTHPSSKEPDVEENIGRLIGLVRAQLMTGLDAALQEADLTSTQWIVLRQIAAGRCKTAADLCRAVCYDTGSMTRVLDKLEENGLIRRERSTEDRRIVYLLMTEHGQQQMPELEKMSGGVIERHMQGFAQQEIEQFRSYLLRMLENGN